MREKKGLLICSIIVMLFVSMACSFSASTAKIKDASMAQDVNGEFQETDVFSPEEIFYALVNVANAPDDTAVKAVWYAVDAEGVDPNSVLYESEFTGGGEITFELSNDYLWPYGTYKVEIYLNDELQETLEFSVE